MKKINLEQYTNYVIETSNQPSWRYKADREADYYDGNQLDSDILTKQRELGIPSAIEPLIGPTIDAVLGMEIKTRQDWRVMPEAEGGQNDDLATALSQKINEAEKNAKADQACSEAFASQVKVGLGWVEVTRNPNPLEYKYECNSIHRNEIWWDWLDRDPFLKNARYLLRRKWGDLDRAVLMFPGKKKIIEAIGNGWTGLNPAELYEGGDPTDLAMSYLDDRGWTIEQQEWLDRINQRVCMYEMWYRIWENALFLQTANGHAVEFNKNDRRHVLAIETGYAKVIKSIVHRTRLSWWLGPHLIWDGPSPHPHNHFPYVPFWGKREDRTGVPYGLIRGMMYLQDEVNARITKMQWILSSVQTIRTKGAVKMTDAEFNNEIARPDCDVILDPKAMSKPGARFEVSRDIQLNEQQFKRLVDAREGIQRTGGVYKYFQGQGDSSVTSGIAINTLVDQSIQSLSDIHQNFKDGRATVGDHLLSFIVEDIGSSPTEVTVKATISKPERKISLNVPMTDELTNTQYLQNDVQRTKLKVSLADVPSSPTFRAQQLQALSASMKNMPGQYQGIMMPFLISLMDLPHHDEVVEAIRNATDQMSPEQVEKVVKEAVDQALIKANAEIKKEELALKRDELMMKKDTAEKQGIKTGVEAAKGAMEVGNMVAINPLVANIAEMILEVAKNMGEGKPDLPGPGAAAMPEIPEETMEPGAAGVPEGPEGMEQPAMQPEGMMPQPQGEIL